MPPHLHERHHELIVVLDGQMLLKTSGAEYMARAGDLLFYRQGLIHEEISQRNAPVHTLFIAFSSTAPLPAFPLHAPDSDGRVKELVWWLVQDLRQRRAMDDCSHLLAAIIGELEWLRTRARDPWLENVSAYLRANYAKKLSLPDLARHAQMSRFAFIRKFKKLVGRTPMTELRMTRLNEARNLLLSTNLPVKSIAPRVGLGDEFQFSKLYRRHFGLSPRQTRTRS